LSGRGLCDELITRPEESYRLCCIVVCDLETSRMGAPYIHDISSLKVNNLTLILLTWRKWWAPNIASKYQMGFNSGFKGLSPGTLSRLPSFLSALQPWVSLRLLNNQSPLLSASRLLYSLRYFHYLQVYYNVIHPSQTRFSPLPLL